MIAEIKLCDFLAIFGMTALEEVSQVLTKIKSPTVEPA